MYNPDDRELDRLSAAAGEHYTPPGTPNWDVLEQTLNKELPQEKEKRRRGLFWFFLLPALFIAGAAWWYTRPASPAHRIAGAPSVTSNNNTKTPGPAHPGTVSPGANADKTSSANTPNTNTNRRPLLPTQKPVLMPNSHAPAASPANNLTTTTRPKDKKAKDIAYQPTAASNEKQGSYRPLSKRRANTGAGYPGTNTPGKNSQDGKTSLARHNRRSGSLAAATSSNTGEPVSRDNNQSNSTDQAVNNTQKDQKDNKPAVHAPGAVSRESGAGSREPGNVKPDTATLVKKPAVDTPAAEKQLTAQSADKKKKNSQPGKAISIGLTGGADMSTVKFNYQSDVGYNIGLLAGYHFNKNWSVYTGAIYTQKNYKMEGYNYHAPAGSPIANYKLDEVSGYCRMWELPIMGRYTFDSKMSSRFFVGAGISSYLMNREYYDYSYKWGTIPYTGHWGTNQHSEFWFSVLDFSAGIEKPLGRHIVGQVEPYAKLPLAGLGSGKIMLSSFGVNVTLQYRKNLGKK